MSIQEYGQEITYINNKHSKNRQIFRYGSKFWQDSKNGRTPVLHASSVKG